MPPEETSGERWGEERKVKRAVGGVAAPQAALAAILTPAA